MKALTQYGRQAEKHWREHCPKMVSALEAQGQLHAMLLEAEEKTKDEMIELTQQFRKQGLIMWTRNPSSTRSPPRPRAKNRSASRNGLRNGSGRMTSGGNGSFVFTMIRSITRAFGRSTANT